MPRLTKTFVLFFVFVFSKNTFAGICDFEPPIDYAAIYVSGYCFYDGTSGFCIPSSYDPDFTKSNSDTTTTTIYDGSKNITRFAIYTLLGDNCVETKELEFDSAGTLLPYPKSYIFKDRYLLKMVFDSTIVNLNHGDTPCDFTIVESSGKKTIFYSNDMKNDTELKKLTKLPEIARYVAMHQIDECKKYRKYLEWLENEKLK
ncbi:MAG: hypothetical protein LBU56_02035 [Rickettsiales bacterium]|jgi:hypothetical protein|nr:hypothetical protein [Rickettsiales bacterium]